MIHLIKPWGKNIYIYAHFFSIINSIFYFLFFWEILIKFRRLRVF